MLLLGKLWLSEETIRMGLLLRLRLLMSMLRLMQWDAWIQKIILS